MISADNFYWVLYEALLKPVGLDCWYFYPWGTQDKFSAYEFGTRIPGREQHVLFHYDQEPLWTNSLGKYDHFEYNYRNPGQYLCVLANSEHSSLKEQICQERGMEDWYYFYHGFLALDWFRDARHLDFEIIPTKPFISLNHIVNHQRAYRMGLTARLAHRGLDQTGAISFRGTIEMCQRELENPFTQLSLQDKHYVQNWLADTPCLPMKLDSVIADGNLSSHFGHNEYRLWQQSLFHVVNETVFYEPKLHLTEKIFKPIVSQRPFLLAAAPGNLAYVRSYGFKTFGDWVDESYDVEQDHSKRLDLIVKEIEKISSLTPIQLKNMYHDMRSTLDHNKQHLFGEFQRNIVDELVNRFDSCIHRWNDTSINKKISLHPDLSKAKQILLG